MQAGFRAVIAPGKGEGFADIFEGNAFNNGLLPIELDPTDWQAIAAAGREHPGQAEVTIDLRDQTVTLHSPGGGASSRSPTFSFEIPESQRQRLLKGLDAIAETLLHDPAIHRHELDAPAWVTPQRAAG